MLNRVTFILAAVALILSLLAGCAKTYDPAARSEIRFVAGSALLRDDATKASATLKTSFGNGDYFKVFARRNNVSSSPVFTGETVSTTDGSSWSYSPERFWCWNSLADYYDFVAVYSQGTVSVMDISGNIAVKASYSVGTDNFDLMMATVRRLGTDQDCYEPVRITFRHVLSAVQVNIDNVSKNASLTLDDYHFENLISSADAKVAVNPSGDGEYSWINTSSSSSAIGGETPGTPVTVNAESRRDGDVELFVPQALDEAAGTGGKPKLVLHYTPYGGAQQTVEIELYTIKKGDKTPITSWEMGVKYTYNIQIRIGGGVQVTLITTDWDEQEASTPGILI